MLGTLLNCAAIILGCIAGLLTRRDIPAKRQLLIKVAVGVALAWVGFSIALGALTSGDWRYFGKLFLVLVISMVAARLLGRLLHLQAALNRAGQFAKTKLSSGNKSDGMLAATILFCAAPLGAIGAIEDGLANYFVPLLIKGIMDGLAAISFVRAFGPRVFLAVLPVAALQAALGFGAQLAHPWLQQHGLLDSIHVVCGFLIVSVSLIVFEVKKVELADYLPAIAIAPAVAWLFR